MEYTDKNFLVLSKIRAREGKKAIRLSRAGPGSDKNQLTSEQHVLVAIIQHIKIGIWKCSRG